MWLFYQIIHVDFIAILTILYLLIFMKTNDAYEYELNQSFRYSLYLLFALLFSDNLDYYFSRLDYPIRFYRLVLLLGYTLRVALLMSAIYILEKDKISEKIRQLLYLPTVINTVLMVSGLFHNHIVWVDAENVVHRELLSYAPHLLSFLYFLTLVAISFFRFRKGKKVESIILMMSALASAMAVAGEILLNTRGILLSVIALMLTFYYLYLHIENFKKDNLTGAFNRTTFFADIRALANGQIIALGEFDLNELKKINDIKGHDEGDKAIVTVANTIMKKLPPSCRLYRMGGDEFVVLFCSMSWDDANSITHAIKKAFGETDYSCAVGLAPWDGVDSFKETYKLADRRMYEDKERQKALYIDAIR